MRLGRDIGVAVLVFRVGVGVVIWVDVWVYPIALLLIYKGLIGKDKGRKFTNKR